jgi:cysteine desulfurase
MTDEPCYLDCNATAPMEPRVATVVETYLLEEFGNAGSRTHEFGARAQKAVERAREQVAQVVDAQPEDVVFTSGATESDNLAILGLQAEGEASGRRHVISTQIEHKAVLEPLEQLQRRGFEVELVPPTAGGWVDPQAIAEALRPETLLVSVMHVNNETGVEQPLEDLFHELADHPAYLHTDAAQGFGKRLVPLQDPRVDLLSVSGHKIYGPKGVGALVCRRRGADRVPLEPLLFGGGQEAGLRPGTQPVALIAGLGEAAEIAKDEASRREETCVAFRGRLMESLEGVGIQVHGDTERVLPHVLNFSIPGLDSEAAMLAMKELVAVSNGSACTSSTYEPSHVLLAMGLDRDEAECALRWSWCHMSTMPDMEQVAGMLSMLR